MIRMLTGVFVLFAFVGTASASRLIYREVVRILGQ